MSLFRNSLSSFSRHLAAFAVAGLALVSGSQAQAGKDTGAFTVVFQEGSLSGKQDRTVTTAGRFAMVKGQYVEFTVDLTTFETIDFTMTGKAAKTDITHGTRTVVFASKFPEHGSTLGGPVSININGPQLVLTRSGPGITMKIQSNDATQGGVFQMEPSKTITYLHQLAPGFGYFPDATGRILFTNHVFIGRESPETAKLVEVSADATASRWLVTAGGRMGAVLGEDATQ